MATLEIMPQTPTWIAKVDLLENSCAYSDECQINANNDLEAVTSWLVEYQYNKNTYLSYKRESLRFLMWCMYERGVTLADLKKEDCEAYCLFLQAPPDKWCSDKDPKKPSLEHSWPTFKNKLSHTAILMAIRVVNSMLNYLVEAQYIRANPLKLIKKYNKLSIDFAEYKYKVWERMLELDEWEAVQQALVNMPEATAQQRDQKQHTIFLFAILYLLGLRIHEVVNHTWSSFRKKDGQWWFFVKGKGDQLGHIPVNEQLLGFVKSYRIYMQRSELPSSDEIDGLIVSTKTKQPLKITQLYKFVKAIGQTAAGYFPDDPAKQQKLAALSPHWLRHLAASHQDKLGISASMIQSNLRHKSQQTTQIYVHAEDLARHNEIQKMRLQNIEPMVTVALPNIGYEFKIKLTKGPVSKNLGIARIIETIEQQIFKSLDCIRVGESLDVLLARITAQGACCAHVELVYQVRAQIVVESVQIWEAALKRAAAVWLFNCEIQSIGLKS